MPEFAPSNFVGLADLALIASVAFVVIAVLWIVDRNEREPLSFVLGVVVVGFLTGLVWASSGVLVDQDPITYGIGVEIARFGAIAVAFALILFRGRRQGWSEVNSIMDGIVYGAAGGLGFGLGQLTPAVLGTVSAGLGTGEISFAGLLGGQVIFALYEASFGGLIGIGFAAALLARKPYLRVLFPILGLVGAVVASFGIAFSSGLLEPTIGESATAILQVLVPVIAIAFVAVWDLRIEGRAISRFVREEAAADGDIARAVSLARSRDVDENVDPSVHVGYLASRRLRNLLAQLAVTRRMAQNRPDDPDLDAQAERLRWAIRRQVDEAVSRQGHRAKTAGIVAMLLTAMLAGVLVAPVEVEAASGWCCHKQSWVSGSTLAAIRDGYAGIAARAAAGCASWAGSTGASWLSAAKSWGARTNIYIAWANIVIVAFSAIRGLSFCDIAKQSALMAYWAAYYKGKGMTVWSTYWAYYEQRAFAFDRCWIWHGLGGTWRVKDMAIGSSPGNTCPGGI